VPGRSHSSRPPRAWSALVVAAGVAVAAAGPARAADVTLEAEAMTVTPGGGAQADAQASGGRALRIPEGGSASGEVAVPQSTTHMFLRARGGDCLGPATASVRIDGVERLVAPVSPGGFGEPGARLSIPPGLHAVSVAVTNGSFAGSPFCDRGALIDRITIVGQPFAPTGWRNARLSKRAPIAANSATLVRTLRSMIKSRPRGALVGFSQYSSPFYVVPPDQPRVRVIAASGRRDMQSQWDSVPLPPDARPAAGTDAHLAVWQPSSDTMWEFWGLTRDGSGNWHARFGGRMPDVSRNEGHFVKPPGTGYGATATSIALLAGTQRIEELRRGVIDHAVDFAVVRDHAREGWCWPAQRTDRPLASRAKGAIPAGTRFRLPARFKLGEYARKHGLSRYAVTVARAVQRHGLVVRDTSSEVGFFAEDPTPLGWDPYPGIFEGLSPDSLGALRNFPWRHLQVVAPPPGTGCTDDPDVDP
jgi:hypothetical protein